MIAVIDPSYIPQAGTDIEIIAGKRTVVAGRIGLAVAELCKSNVAEIVMLSSIPLTLLHLSLLRRYPRPGNEYRP